MHNYGEVKPSESFFLASVRVRWLLWFFSFVEFLIDYIWAFSNFICAITVGRSIVFSLQTPSLWFDPPGSWFQGIQYGTFDLFNCSRSFYFGYKLISCLSVLDFKVSQEHSCQNTLKLYCWYHSNIQGVKRRGSWTLQEGKTFYIN